VYGPLPVLSVITVCLLCHRNQSPVHLPKHADCISPRAPFRFRRYLRSLFYYWSFIVLLCTNSVCTMRVDNWKPAFWLEPVWCVYHHSKFFYVAFRVGPRASFGKEREKNRRVRLAEPIPSNSTHFYGQARPNYDRRLKNTKWHFVSKEARFITTEFGHYCYRLHIYPSDWQGLFA